MGGSSGAAAALTMAWFHPELYRRVLSYSGTFVDQARGSNPKYEFGAWEYHSTLIPNSERKPLRIWFHVSELDNGAAREESTHGNWVLANQRLSKVLKDKGYPHKFVFAEGGRHTDPGVILQTLPDALAWLWQGYAVK